jgi:L-amino acid N-acyltransferase YncA
MKQTPTDITIRHATATDGANIARIHVETWQYAYKGTVPQEYLDQLSIEKRTQTWTARLAKPESGVYAVVAEKNGSMLGWCTYGKSRDDDTSSNTGELHGIYIHPTHIGHGAGSALMAYILDALKKEGYKRVTLWVQDANSRARSWYEHKGWKLEGTTKTIPLETIVITEVRYIKSL